MQVSFGGRPFVITTTLKELIQSYITALDEEAELGEVDVYDCQIREVSVGVLDSGIFKDLEPVGVRISCVASGDAEPGSSPMPECSTNPLN